MTIMGKVIGNLITIPIDSRPQWGWRYFASTKDLFICETELPHSARYDKILIVETLCGNMSKREDIGCLLMVVFQAPENEKVSTKALIGIIVKPFCRLPR